MKCSKLAIWVVSALAVLGVGAMIVAKWREPWHEGASLSHWLKMRFENAIDSGVFERLSSDDEFAREARPWLVSQVSVAPGSYPPGNSYEPSWMERRAMEQWYLRGNVFLCLEQLGSVPEAIPALIPLLSDPNDPEMRRIREILNNTLPASLPHLLKAADDPLSGHARKCHRDTERRIVSLSPCRSARPDDGSAPQGDG